MGPNGPGNQRPCAASSALAGQVRSRAAKAISALRSQGEFGYGETADKRRAEAGRVALAMAN